MTSKPLHREPSGSCSPSQATLSFLRQFARVYMPTPSGAIPAVGVILN
ncbi:MAG: hypothetical protein K2K72_03310 [Duncaniella sp.]|nr:hypothetical protein [Duncaniella sp.]